MPDSDNGIDPREKAFIRAELDLVTRHVKSLDTLRAITLGTAGGLLYLLVMVVADHWITDGLPLVVRRGLLAVALAAAVAGAFVFILRPLTRRINDLYAGWLIEQRFPKLRNNLITTIEVQRNSQTNTAVVAGLIHRTARQLARRDVLVSLPTQGVSRSLLFVAISAVLLLLYAAVAPKPVLPSLARALGADIPSPTRTVIDWISPVADLSVVRGTPIVFEARLTGHLPGEAWVEFSAPDGRNWSAGPRLSLRLGNDAAAGLWRGTQPGVEVQSSMCCRIAAGDAVSESRRIDVRPAPVETGVEITYRYPEYTRLATRTDNGPDIDALVGTRIELTARANVPIRSGVIHYENLDGAAARQMERLPNDYTRATASWTVETDEEFRITLRDAYGATNVRPLLHRLRARADAAPLIQLAEPHGDLELDVSAAMELRAIVSDDFGLTDLAIAYRNGSSAGRIPLGGELSSESREVRLRQRIPVSAFSPQPGDTIEWNLVARDNRRDLRNEPAYQTSVGPTRRITIKAEARQVAANDSKKQDHPPPAGGQDAQSASASGGTPRESSQCTGGASGDKPGDSSEPTHSAQPSDSGLENLLNSQKAPVERLVEKLGREPGSNDPRPGDARQPGEKQSSDANADKPEQPAQKSDGHGNGPMDRVRSADSGLGEGQSGNKTDGDRNGDSAQPRGVGTGDDTKKGENGPTAGSDGGEGAQRGDGGSALNGENKQRGASSEGSGENQKAADEKRRSGSGQDETGAPAGGGREQSGPSNGSNETGGAGGKGADRSNSKTADENGDAGRGDGHNSSEGQAKKPGNQKAKDDQAEGAGDKRDGSRGAGGNEKSGQSTSGNGAKSDANGGSSGKSRQAGGTGESPGNGGNGPRSGASPPQRDEQPLKEDGRFRPEGQTGKLPVDVSRLQRAVDELERLQREGKLDDKLLAELGWTKAQVAEFIKQYRRQAARNPSGPARTQVARTTRPDSSSSPGDTSLQLSAGTGGEIAGGLDASRNGKNGAPTLKAAAPEQVPAEYRDLLDGYYRTMARDGANSP